MWVLGWVQSEFNLTLMGPQRSSMWVPRVLAAFSGPCRAQSEYILNCISQSRLQAEFNLSEFNGPWHNSIWLWFDFQWPLAEFNMSPIGSGCVPWLRAEFNLSSFCVQWVCGVQPEFNGHLAELNLSSIWIWPEFIGPGQGSMSVQWALAMFDGPLWSPIWIQSQFNGCL